MKIIESTSEFEIFLEQIVHSDLIFVPIYCSGNKPVYVDELSVLYIYTVYKDLEGVIIFNHSEGNHLPINLLDKIYTSKRVFVYGKKRFNQFYNKPNVIDLDLISYFHCNRPIEEDFDTTAHEFFIRNFGSFENLNTIIPLVKHIEKCQQIVAKFFDVLDYFEFDESFKSYNTLFIDTLHKIEKSGLFVNNYQFKKSFPESIEYDNFVYSEYNLYTTTGRPSNRFNRINFAALNKENGQRAPFVSRFGDQGFILSFDYDSYHLRLLGELIDYQFPESVSVHEYLSKYYFTSDEISPEKYSEAKSISFRQLYGGISKEYLSIPFFAKVHEYTKLLWSKYQTDGYIETPVFSRKLHKSFFSDMNAAKLLNYLLQSFESERNMAVLHNILNRTQSFSSKLILYLYDCIVVDFNRKDGASFIQIIQEEMEQKNRYPVKIEAGYDYHSMKFIKKPN